MLLCALALAGCKKDEFTEPHTCEEPEEVVPEVLIPSSEAGVILMSRYTQQDWLSATYSFEYATRTDRDLVLNDWDLEYGNGPGNLLSVNMSTADNSRIADLGPVDFYTVRDIPHEAAFDEKAVAQKDHVYVIHTRDNNSDFYTKMLITNMADDMWIRFTWVRSDDGLRFAEH